MSHDLITQIFMRKFDNQALNEGNDAAVPGHQMFNKHMMENFPGRIAISTDSHVVWPLFFPGGDIGRLAVCGSVNDISMVGAEPSFLTAGFILEEGLEIAVLERIVESMQQAAIEAGVNIVAGDTKVVQNGKADGVFINTSGVGFISNDTKIGGSNARIGDKIIVSGPIGDHGIAVLEARGELGFKSGIVSDVAPLNHLVKGLLEICPEIHVLRDPTRGGLATSLNEIAKQSQVCLEINEELVPIRPPVRAACEMLGFDPFFVANEGKLIAIVDHACADAVVEKMHQTLLGVDAAIIGKVTDRSPGRVLMKTTLGSTRVVEMLSGEMLPRIC